MAPTHLNIVHIHGHDGARMFSPYGYNTETPRLQRLAEEGMTFRQACCAAPTCSPSRVARMVLGHAVQAGGVPGDFHEIA